MPEDAGPAEAVERGCAGCGQYMTTPERKSGRYCVTCRGVTA